MEVSVTVFASLTSLMTRALKSKTEDKCKRGRRSELTVAGRWNSEEPIFDGL
jgi:hypothetical protein